MIELTPEQRAIYNRYIACRDKVGLVRTKTKYKWVPMRDYTTSVEIAGMNHPIFEVNDDWIEYKEAFMAWLVVEPAFREEERMRMSRGDYGAQDSWDEKGSGVTDVSTKIKDDQ